MWVPPCEVGREAHPAHAGVAAAVHEHGGDEADDEQHLGDCEERDHGRRVAGALRSRRGGGQDGNASGSTSSSATTGWSQGVAPERVRESWEEALAVARAAGLENPLRPLVEVRLADLDRPAS